MNIKVNYSTGNSFETHNTSTIIDYNWTDIKIIEENILAIYEHQEFLDALKEWRITEQEKNEIIEKAKKRFWFVDGIFHGENEYEFSIKLKLDNNTFQKIHCDWVGYFESFESAEVSFDSDTYLEKAKNFLN